MPLPSSGQIDIGQIASEYWKDVLVPSHDLVSLRNLYNLSGTPISLNQFYNKSWTVVSILDVEDPDGGTFTEEMIRSGTTTAPWEFFIRPNLDGYPNQNMSFNVSGQIDNVELYGGFSGASGSIELEYYNGSSWNPIATRFLAAGGSSSVFMNDGPTTKNFSITSSNVSSVQFRITIDLSGDIDAEIAAGEIWIELQPVSITGIDNQVRRITNRDRFTLFPMFFRNSGIGWSSYCEIS